MARLQTLVMTAVAAAILTPAAMAQATEYPMAKTYSSVEEALAAASSTTPTYTSDTVYESAPYAAQTVDQGTPITNIEIFDTPVHSVDTQVIPAATTYTYESPTTTYTSTFGVDQQAASAQYTYSVVRGDTLYSIATRNGLKVSDLMNANGLSTSAINPGQALLIPSSTQASTTYVQAVPTANQNVISASQIVRNVEPLPTSGQNYRVLPGDTLSSISRQYCTNVNAITTSSGIDRDSILSPGQYLTVPQGICAQ